MNVDISTSPILSLITFLPLVGVIPLLFLGDDESSKRNARRIALYTTLLGAVLNVWLIVDYRILANGTVDLIAAIIDRANAS